MIESCYFSYCRVFILQQTLVLVRIREKEQRGGIHGHTVLSVVLYALLDVEDANNKLMNKKAV